MKTAADIDLLLQEAGPREEDIVAVARTSDERWVIQFEDVDIEVEFNAESGRVLFAAVIGTPPPLRARAVYETLLSYTMLWRETGGVRMGLTGPAGQAVQMVDFGADELDPPLAAVVAANLAARTLVWRTFLHDEAEDAEAPLAVDLSQSGFIRV